MPRPIGYYVHHHGTGHRTRAAAIAAIAPDRFTLIGSGVSDGIDLPDDRMPDGAFAGDDGTAIRPGALHYAPLDHDGVRRRVAAVAGWIARERPSLMVVDVSVEIAMLARLASVPTVVVRLSGERTDPPHLACFRSAVALLAPFAAALDDPRTPADIVARTRYAPGIAPRTPSASIRARQVTVVLGTGGANTAAPRWAAAARATPDWTWLVLGPVEPPLSVPGNLIFAGWVADADARIAEAAVVVGGAGDGVVSAVLRARRPFVCLPEQRPYDEQRSKAAALARAGAAVVCDDPARADWPALLAAALAIDARAQAALDDGAGAERTAAWLIDLADRGAAA